MSKLWPVLERTGVLLLARVVGWEGDLLTQAATTSIAYGVYDSDTGATIATGSLPVGTVILDAAQTGANWPYADGYNFRWNVPPASFPDGSRRVIVEVIVTPAAGEVFSIGPWKFLVEERRS